MGRAVSPPCCSIWGQTTVEVLKTMVTSFKRSMHTLLHSVPWPFSRLPLTHASTGDSWTLTGKFGPVSWGITAPLSWVLVHKRFCVCPPRPWVMLKIHQARLRQYMNHALSDVQAGFRKDRGTRDQITNICWIIKKGRKLQKNIYFCFIDYTKAFNSVITANCGKFFKRWGYQTTLPASWETWMQVKRQQLELDMEKQTGSKLGKEYVKAVYCHSAYSTYMQHTSWECQPGWSISWNQDFSEKYQ